MQLDTCYHLPCDTLENIDSVVLQDMASASAYTLEKLMGMHDIRDHLYG